MVTNIMIVGVGGQGTLLTSRILGGLAEVAGYDVKLSEVHGMAQRGGSVVSHVRIGSDVYSPLISEKTADIIIAFEAAEAVRNIKYLKDNGLVIVNKKIVQPVTASLTGKTFDEETMISYLEKVSGKVIAVDTDQACTDLGNSKVVNIVLLGAACNTGLIDKEQIKSALKLLVKPEFYELNCKAVDYVK